MMEVKKFEAPTLAQALQVIKRELGPDAIIISTKNNKSGFGLLNKSSVEVTAAVSQESLEKKRLAERRLSPSQKDDLADLPSQKVRQSYDVLSGAKLKREMNKAKEISSNSRNINAAQAIMGRDEGVGKTSAKTVAPSVTQRRYIDIQDDDAPAEQVFDRTSDRTRISSEASQRRQNHEQVPSARSQISENLRRSPGIHSPRQGFGQITESSRSRETGILSKILGKLIESGIEEPIVRELGDELKAVMIREHITQDSALKLHMARLLMSRIRVARPLSERLRVPSTPRVITFVGPTGVGKTTTIAKIAAELILSQKRPVVLATTDTFKIAAVEQLQTYANILHVPLEVCASAQALESLAQQLGPEEVVLLDTAGYGPRDEKKLTELQETLGGIRMETHLCLAATTRDIDLVDIVKRFRIFDPSYFVVTKLDETAQFGNIFNLAAKTHMPLSYFTMGQRVPEDMEIATKERLADLLLSMSDV